MHDLPAEIQQTFIDKYGLAGLAIIVFASVIAFLFKLLMNSHKEQRKALKEELQRAIDSARDAERMRSAEREAHAVQLAKWEVERAEWELDAQKLRADHEQRERERADRHARDLHELRREFQAREDESRKENSEVAERMAASHTAAMDKVTAVLQKFYDRFVGTRARMR